MADLIEMQINVKSNADAATSGMEKLGSTVLRQLKEIDRLEKEFKQLDRAMNKNKISGQLYAQEVQKLNSQIDALTKNLNRSTTAQKAQTQAQMAATKSSNRMGVVTQQAGYQVSDFIVQVQSGTNVFVAFGQQASQLVGVLPLVADRIGLTARAAIALSAGLGIIIPLVTLFGASWLRSKEAAEDAGDKLRTTEDILKDLKSSISDADKELRLLHSTFTDITQLEVVDQMDKLKQQIQFIKNEGAEAVREYVEALGGSAAMLENAEKSIAALAASKQEQIDTLQANLDTLIAKQKLLDIEESYKELLGEINDIEEDTQQKNLEVISSLRERELLANAYLEGGEKAVKAEQRLLENMALVAELQKEKYDFSDEMIQAILRQVKATQDLEDEVDDAKERTKQLAEEAEKAASAFKRMSSFSQGLDQKIAVAAAELKALREDGSVSVEKTIAQLRFQADALYEAKKATGELTQADEDLYITTKAQIAAYAVALRLIEEQEQAKRDLAQQTRDNAKADNEALQAAQRLRKELDGPLVSAVGSVSDAFGDFIARGLQDFKGFVSQILGSFQNMIAQMIATAARNRIMIGLGMGGAGTVAGTTSAFAGPIGSFLGTTGAAGVAGTGLMGGVGSVFGSGGIGLSGSFSALGSILGGGSLGGGFALGAAIPAIAAVVAVVGLFTKKVKELDSGLRVTIDGTDTLVETFSLLEKSRLFGLIKSKSTEFQAAGADIADPVTEAVSNIQSEILKAADAFGIGAGLFENFTYKFQVSLKGLTEDEKMQAINQELAKMGDEFASLSGHFSDMNSLLAAANERYNLQIRLLETIGKQEEALSMRRESELSSVHELNRELLQAIYAVEDAQRAVDIAFSNLASVIDREKRTLEQGYADSVDALKAGFDNLIDGIEARLEAAQRAASISQGVYSALESALRGRGFVSESQFSMARETATSYLRELRGAGRIEDEQALEDALKIVAEPSQDLYEDFVSYQRDFQKQTNVIRDLETKTKLQLSTDEKTLLAIQEEKDAAQIRHEESLSKLDDNLQSELLALDKQYNELVGIKEVNLTMVEAIKAVENAINNLELKQAAAAKIGGVGGGGVKADFGGNIDLLDKYDAGKDFTRDGKTYDFIKLSGANQLLDAAQQLGIQTAGQTGAQIQQAISNAGNLAVNLDNATRNQQFALGGYFSGGVRMVGERGPELEMTGPSRIMSNNDTRKMLQNPDLVEAVKDMRQEIAELRNEQRQLGINNNKYTKRTYDLYRQWDTEGLPAERT